MHWYAVHYCSLSRKEGEVGEKKKLQFDIIYESARELMRGIGFLENYRGSERRKKRMFELGPQECLNEDLKRKAFGRLEFLI